MSIQTDNSDREIARKNKITGFWLLGVVAFMMLMSFLCRHNLQHVFFKS
ncbi:MAG TPA: hypothetical protein V6D47_03010 [Oscillatoriaceae cyanobacterium]